MTEKMTGTIFDIQRYSLHDGPGIRTLVFMKGCPLKCLWCSNPESQDFSIEVGHIKKNCVLCGDCKRVCKWKAIQNESYMIEKDLCQNCGDCAIACRKNGKKIIGKQVGVEELLASVESDRLFYRNSEGGVTVGGGEPLSQSAFVTEFLKACKETHLNTAVETCGYAPWPHVKQVILYTDTLLFDLKHMDSDIHKTLTGVDNKIILENATKAGALVNTVFRIPLIPGYNDDDNNLKTTFAFVKKIEKAIRVEILPYHNLGENKYPWISKEYRLHDLKPYTEKQKEILQENIAAMKPDIEVKVI